MTLVSFRRRDSFVDHTAGFATAGAAIGRLRA
jgi:hypothetical protein